MADTVNPPQTGEGEGETRRDFLYLATAALGTVGVASFAWPFIYSMNPSAEVLALSTTEFDLSPIEVGPSVTIVWRGNPVFIRRRTAEEIKVAVDTPLEDMKYPEADSERAEKPEWLIMVGVCTHLGCVPLGQKAGDPKGDYGGWFCPCHGSHYDTSGRIRKGPAPKNLEVPKPIEFLDGNLIRIG